MRKTPKLANRNEKPKERPVAMLKLVKSPAPISLIISLMFLGNGKFLVVIDRFEDDVNCLYKACVMVLSAKRGMWKGWLLKYPVKLTLSASCYKLRPTK